MIKEEVRRQEETMTPPQPALPAVPRTFPSRLGRPVAVGVLVEVLTLVAIMVTLATRQFDWLGYVFALLGVVTPLALLTWGFSLLVRDETRSHATTQSEMQTLSEAWTQQQAQVPQEEPSRREKPVSPPRRIEASVGA